MFFLLIYSYPWICYSVQDVCDQIAGQCKKCQKYHIEHGKRNITLGQCLIGCVSDSRDLEQSLCDHGSAKQVWKCTSKDGDDRNQSISERMVIDHLLLRYTLSSCSTDVVCI